MKKTVFLLLPLLVFSTNVYSFDEGDWISFTMTRFVSSIAMDNTTVYFGTTGGLIRYNKVEQHWGNPFTLSDGLPDERIVQVAYDPDIDQIWIDTPLGPASYNPTFKRWRRETVFPKAMVRSDKDSLSLPDFFMPFGYDFYPQGYILDRWLDRYDVTDYLRDDWGDNVWVGTWGLGVGFGSLRSWSFRFYQFGLYQNDVRDMCLDEGVIWFGGSDMHERRQGISRYDRSKGTWEYFVEGYEGNLENASVNAIRASQQYVWFGTSRGLQTYDKKKREWSFQGRPKELGGNYVTCLEYYQNPDKKEDEILFIGTSAGLYFYRVKKGILTRAKNQAISTEYINCLKWTHGYFWIGTQAGVFRISLSGGARGVFSTPDGIVNTNINGIGEDKEKVWFATDRGILGYDPATEEREVYQISGNYPGDRPLKIEADERSLWVGTRSGVWRMDKKTQSWEHFTAFDGLIDNDIQAMVLDGDRIWFGTPEGATLFNWRKVFFSE